MSYLTTGGPDKEHRTDKLPPAKRIREGPKEGGDTTAHNMSYQPPRNPCAGNHLDWEMCAPPGRALNQTKYEHKKDDWPETTWKTNPITINPETASHVAEQFSWVPLSHCSPPGRPFPTKSFALSASVSPRTIHFWVLDKSPLLGPGMGPPPVI